MICQPDCSDLDDEAGEEYEDKGGPDAESVVMEENPDLLISTTGVSLMKNRYLSTTVTRCWKEKEAHNFQKVAQNVSVVVFTYTLKVAKYVTMYTWATFVIKFVAYNFQKSPNLVTLLSTDYKVNKAN